MCSATCLACHLFLSPLGTIYIFSSGSSLHEKVERRSANHRDVHSRSPSGFLLWTNRDGGWNPIFGPGKFFIHSFDVVFYVDAMARVVRITRLRIVNPKRVGTDGGPTGQGQGRGRRCWRGTRTWAWSAIESFASAGIVHSLSRRGRWTRAETVIRRRTRARVRDECISAGKVYSLRGPGRETRREIKLGLGAIDSDG